MQKTLQDCTYRMNETNLKTYRYLLKKEGMPSGASPSLDAWVSLNITWGALGIPKLELLPLLLFLISRPPRLDNSSTQNFNEKLGKIRQYNKANHHSKYCSKQIHILFLHCVYCNVAFPWLNPLI